MIFIIIDYACQINLKQISVLTQRSLSYSIYRIKITAEGAEEKPLCPFIVFIADIIT